MDVESHKIDLYKTIIIYSVKNLFARLRRKEKWRENYARIPKWNVGFCWFLYCFVLFIFMCKHFFAFSNNFKANKRRWAFQIDYILAFYIKAVFVYILYWHGAWWYSILWYTEFSMCIVIEIFYFLFYFSVFFLFQELHTKVQTSKYKSISCWHSTHSRQK